ncbi:MAG TPA: hypothetical protein VLM83_13450, partial [Anaerolineales bacterium]|nr:hypothetical protein [Anaerolineales bacterium]
ALAETSGEPEPEVLSPAALTNQRAVEALVAQIKALSGGVDEEPVAVEAPVVPESQATPEVGHADMTAPEQPKPRRTRARKVVEPVAQAEPEELDAKKRGRTRTRTKPVSEAADGAIHVEPGAGTAEVDPAVAELPGESEPEAMSAAALANLSAVEALAAQVRALREDAGAPEAGNGAEPAPEHPKPRRSRARKPAVEELPAAEEQMVVEKHVENQ